METLRDVLAAIGGVVVILAMVQFLRGMVEGGAQATGKGAGHGEG